MANWRGDTPRTLCGLPSELRLEIWDAVFRSITVSIERGPYRGEETVTDTEAEDSDDQDTVRFNAKRAISELPAIPADVLAIRSACRLFAIETRRIWHSKVTYDFPSTVAFVDVLSQWPEERVRKLRYAYVCDYPFPLYPYGDQSCYHSFAFSDALPIFSGLELEVLTVENIWLLPTGEPVDGWCLDATYHAIKSLLRSQGWRNLRYVSGTLGLRPTQKGQLEAAVDEYRLQEDEPDFAYAFGAIRPQTDNLETHFPDGTVTRDEDAIREVEKWYSEHPEAGAVGDFTEGDPDLQVAVWARRGARARTMQDGARLSPLISGLLSHMTWIELRETDEYLVDDGVDDSTAHL